MRTPTLLLFSLFTLSACWTADDFEEYDLTRTPFGSEYVDRGDATLYVELAQGYTCPDGTTARIYHVDPVGVAGPRPLAVIFHGRGFDYIDEQGRNYTEDDRLTAAWASTQAEQVLGLAAEPGATGEGEGAWAGLLLAAGWSVTVPTNCWGDLWHGRGQNDDASEGFSRLGAWMASDAIRLGRERPGVAPDRVLVVGLGEGGRAVSELVIDGVTLDAAVVDSSPDWLAPVVTAAAQNRAYVNGLLAIWDVEVGAIEDPEAQLDALRASLRRDSMVHVVQDLGFRAPLVYGWSPLDERIDAETSRPAAEAIGASYPPGGAQVIDWQTAEHAPSNRHPEQVQPIIEWLQAALGPLSEEPPAE